MNIMHEQFSQDNWRDYLPATLPEKKNMPVFESSGILLVNKHKHLSSADIIRFLKQLAKFKKIGHAGTLDPFAEGLLLILINKATRRSQFLMQEKKTYMGNFRLGVTSDTQDITGKLKYRNIDVFPTATKVKETAKQFCGTILQTPPMYSAKKIQGKALYKYARNDEQVEIPPKSVEVFSFEIKAENSPHEFSYKIVCGKGTYIRTLIHDLGNKLGCGAVVTSLVRLAIGEFSIEQSFSLEQLQGILQIEQAVLTL